MELSLRPTPPFDFHLSASVFPGDKQIRGYENGKFWQVLRVDGKLVLVTIWSSGTTDEPGLKAELSANEELLPVDRRKIKETIYSIFGLSLDLNGFYEQAGEDAILGKLIQRLRGLKSVTTATAFEALVSSIIEQQISLAVSRSMENKLVRLFGSKLHIDGEIYYAFPLPEEIAPATIEQLKQCGLSSRKAEYIKGVAELITAKKLDLENLKTYQGSKAIIDELVKIRGVGIWTAELTALRGLRKLDVIPADDLGLRRIISHYYFNDRKISGEEARQRAGSWGNWKGLAAFYLIAAWRLGMEVGT